MAKKKSKTGTKPKTRSSRKTPTRGRRTAMAKRKSPKPKAEDKSPTSTLDVVLGHMHMAEAALTTDHGRVDHLWKYLKGERTQINKRDEGKLGYFTEVARALVNGNSNDTRFKYFNEHYVNGVDTPVKDGKEGETTKVYKKSVGKADEKELGPYVLAAKVVAALRKKADEYDSDKASAEAVAKAIDAKRKALYERPMEVLGAEGRDVEALVSDVQGADKPADRKKLVAGIQKDPNVAYRTAAVSPKVESVLVEYSQEDGKDTPLTAEVQASIADARLMVQLSEASARLNAAINYDPNAKYEKKENGKGNGKANGKGAPKK